MNLFLVLKDLSISRCILPADTEPTICELHHFADAFQMAYGPVSYLQTVHKNGSICCSFLMGKGYLAKDRKTVPQLELLAAVVAVKFNALIKGELKSCDYTIIFLVRFDVGFAFNKKPQTAISCVCV